MARRIKNESAATKELLDECEIEAGELMRMLKGLKEFSRPYLKLLPDKRLHGRGEDFLRGLLSDLERKSIEPIAERLGQYRRPLQYFIGESDWDHRPMLDLLCQQVVGDLGEASGVLVIDSSAFPKKGRDSVGVTRQWCGRLGKKENCQLGVFLGYVSNKGHALVDERLYMPRDWGRDKARRKKCLVPPGLGFKTAAKLALDMLGERCRALPHRWIVADDEFGRGFAFRRELQRMGERYVLDVPSSLSVRDVNAPRPPRGPGEQRGARRKVPFLQARRWMAGLKDEDWEKIYVRDGVKAPLIVWAARARVQTKEHTRCSKGVQWVLVVKTNDKVPEYRYCLSNAEESVSLKEMVHAASARQWIEDCFQRAKGKVGLDHYEVRSWGGWHHHMTLCLLALYFLVLEQRRLNRNTPAVSVQQTAEALGEILRDPDTDLKNLARKITNRLRRNEQTRIDYWRKLDRLPPSWTIVRAGRVPLFAQ
jgi:SRSO17 transposase